MADKENKGGWLKPGQVEEDLEAKDKTGAKQTYVGSQDTGDDTLRQMGTSVQQRDGRPEEENKEGS